MDLELYKSIYKTKKGRCLLIGGDTEMQRTIKEQISACDYETLIIKEFSLAVAKMKEICPDLVLIPIRDFDIDVEAFFSHLYKEECNISRIILLVPQGAQDSVVQLFISQGIHHILAYPFHPLEFQLHIKDWVTSHKYEQLVEERFHDLMLANEKIEKEKGVLSRYFSKDMVSALLSGDISSELGGTTLVSSVLFCDLRNSTSIAESIEPVLFWDFLNKIFTDITDIIFGEGGVVNKFLGDGILATFGCPKPLTDDAWHCVQVAVKIRKYLDTFNQFRPEYLIKPVRLGIGITRGKLFVGNIGSVNQMEFAVLGDPVNLASRLESLTKTGRLDILMDEHIYKEIKKRVIAKKLNIKNIRGKIQEVAIYYLEKTLA